MELSAYLPLLKQRLPPDSLIQIWLQALRSQLGLESSNLRFRPFGSLLCLFGSLPFLLG
jgi:hypothetical protein